MEKAKAGIINVNSIPKIKPNNNYTKISNKSGQIKINSTSEPDEN
jgi:hypothetical protein